MRIRTRKFIGTIGTVLWLGAYALMAMVLGGMAVVGRGMVVELAYFMIAGVAWIPVAMVIIRWMSKPDSSLH